MSNKKQIRSSRKTAKGLNLGRKLGNPAKAGKRRPPVARSGAHVTNEFDRKRASFLFSLGVKFYRRPHGWIAPGETS